MNRTALLLAVCLIGLSACKEEGSVGSGGSFAKVQSYAEPMMAPAPAGRAISAEYDAGSMVMDRSKLGNRKVEESHALLFWLDNEDLMARHQRDVKKCLALGCELIDARTYVDQNATLQARFAPDKLAAYLDFLTQGAGELREHNVGTTDKTLEFIDTQARVDNLEALRTRLRDLLNRSDTIEVADEDGEGTTIRKSLTVSEILEIERELNRVESDLNSIKGVMRHLATVTDMATVTVNYQVPYQDVEVRWKDLSLSFAQAWKAFVDALSSVILFIGGVLPWIPVWFLGFWLAVKAIAFTFRKVEWSRYAIWKRK